MTAALPLEACRICASRSLTQVLDLGDQAFTGIFPRRENPEVPHGPLTLILCQDCGLAQLGHTFDFSTLYGKDYGYRSGLNASMVRHLESKVSWLLKRRPLVAGDVVLDIGSNDGTTLGHYPSYLRRIGIDPTTEKFRKFHPQGLETRSDFFTADTFRKHLGKAKPRIITSISMFYDLPAPFAFVQDVASLLADDGVWHLEQSYCPLMLETTSYDTVCHEHLEFYGLKQNQWMTSRAGLRITEVQFNDVNGGSFAVTVEKGHGDAPEVAAILKSESRLSSRATWEGFAQAVERHRTELLATLRRLKAEGKRVFRLGASTKGNVVLQHCGNTADLVEAIAEVNPDKYGCVTPGTRIPILSEEEARARKPDVWLVLPWHLRAAFLERERAFLEAGGALLFALPKVELVGKP